MLGENIERAAPGVAHRGVRPLGTVAMALLAFWSTSARAQAADVVVLEADPAAYSTASRPNVDARREVSRKFFETNSDGYDLLIVFPTFATEFGGSEGGDAVGLHTSVRNEVAGLGRQLHDEGPAFGSAARLKGYIDVGALVPGAGVAGTQQTLGIVAHEVAHQFAAFLGNDLVGRDRWCL